MVTQSLRDRGTLIAWGAMAGFTTTMFIPDFVFRGCQARHQSSTRLLTLGPVCLLAFQCKSSLKPRWRCCSKTDLAA